MKTRPEWKVFIHEPNSNEFIPFNVFNSSKFVDGLQRLKKSMKKTPITDEEAIKEIERLARYSFWGKCEYELILTDLFCHISNKEIRRLRNTDADKRLDSVELMHSRKIDVFEQLYLNWNQFAKYVLENLGKI